jgi:hypothetical protein
LAFGYRNIGLSQKLDEVMDTLIWKLEAAADAITSIELIL